MGLIWKTRSDGCSWGVAGCPRWEGEPEDEAGSLLPASSGAGRREQPFPAEVRFGIWKSQIWMAVSAYQGLLAIEQLEMTVLHITCVTGDLVGRASRHLGSRTGCSRRTGYDPEPRKSHSSYCNSAGLRAFGCRTCVCEIELDVKTANRWPRKNICSGFDKSPSPSSLSASAILHSSANERSKAKEHSNKQDVAREINTATVASRIGG